MNIINHRPFFFFYSSLLFCPTFTLSVTGVRSQTLTLEPLSRGTFLSYASGGRLRTEWLTINWRNADWAGGGKGGWEGRSVVRC